MRKILTNILRKLFPMIPDLKQNILNNQILQRQLFIQLNFLQQQHSFVGFRNVGFRVYSQFDEDGVLLYIFSVIGFTNKVLVDIGFGNPFGANSTNLIVNWGFNGLLIEGNRGKAKYSEGFFSKHPDSIYVPPVIENLFISPENVNDILSNNNVKGDIDLLSIDIDGLDYWVWSNLNIISPRVVIIEAHPMWGKERAVTIPNIPEFDRFNIHPDYCGASIPALIKLGHKKGYQMVACNHYGFNLVFLRNDLVTEALPLIPIEECFKFQPPALIRRRINKLKNVVDLKWIDI